MNSHSGLKNNQKEDLVSTHKMSIASWKRLIKNIFGERTEFPVQEYGPNIILIWLVQNL